MEKAQAVAEVAHEGQVDKAGLPYVEAHVADVVRRLGDAPDEVRAVAWLHDVLEDTAFTADDLLREFEPEIVEAVVAITHRPHEPRADYYARVKANSLALRVKLADIASNTDPERVALLDESTRARLAVKYEKALVALA